MDGPNVRWATFGRLQKKLQLEYSSKLLNVGSCGIHIVYSMHLKLQSLKLDVIYRTSCQHYTHYGMRPQLEEKSATKQNLYLLPFCAHRWVENVRAMEIHQFIRQYIYSIE